MNLCAERESGAPGAIPTRDLPLRRRTLYATELREQETSKQHTVNSKQQKSVIRHSRGSPGLVTATAGCLLFTVGCLLNSDI
jgi:hypothetical protein